MKMSTHNLIKSVFPESYSEIGSGLCVWVHTPGHRFNISTNAGSDAFNRLLDWKMESPRHLRSMGAEKGERTMQRQYTIELRVDYADNEKNETMRTALQHAARHVYATAVLLSDGVKPQVAVFSDDFFSGHEEIKLLDDVIANGLDKTNMADTDETVSSELMSAMKDIG